MLSCSTTCLPDFGVLWSVWFVALKKWNNLGSQQEIWNTSTVLFYKMPNFSLSLSVLEANTNLWLFEKICNLSFWDSHMQVCNFVEVCWQLYHIFYDDWMFLSKHEMRTATKMRISSRKKILFKKLSIYLNNWFVVSLKISDPSTWCETGFDRDCCSRESANCAHFMKIIMKLSWLL